MNLSIFAKPAFLNTNPYSPFEYKGVPPKHGYLQRVSSMIRGGQIAEYIGAKLNPESGYENDVCIYVKPMVRKDQDIELAGKPYIDIIDGHNLGQLALKHPEAGVIVCSQADYDTMKSCIPNEVVFIPQQHCNFERVRKTVTDIKTVGIIGTRGAFGYIPQEIKDGIRSRGLELLEYSSFYTRQDIIDFYLKIDLQVVWRPYKKRLSNPLKIVNAASFGIPTIALDEKAFKEVEGCYMPVNNVAEFFKALDNVNLNVGTVELYHIENVASLYRNLCTI